MPHPLLRNLGFALLILLLLFLGAVGALALGWLPIPGFVTGWVAQAQGLDPEETKALEKTVNLYGVLKRSPESPLVDQAIALATQGAREDDWAQFAKDAWPQVTSPTKARIREQLDMSPDDFGALIAIIDRQVAVVEEVGTFRLTPDEADTLNRLAEDYDLLGLLEKLQK